MSRHYILDHNKEPIEADLMTWARWFETANRTVKATDIGEVRISTVFLGLDHSFSETGPPILYETMVFGGPLDEFQWRYSSREAALAGHARAVAKVEAGDTDDS